MSKQWRVTGQSWFSPGVIDGGDVTDLVQSWFSLGPSNGTCVN